MSPSAPSHDRIEALIAADALGGLDEPDRRELERTMERHGPRCLECRRLLGEYADAAAHLALALEPEPLSPGAEDRLVEEARQARPGPIAVPVPQPERGRNRRIASLRPRAWAAAAAVAVAVVAGSIGYVVAPRGPAPTRVATLGDGPQVLQVAFTPGDREALIVGTNVPSPPAGKVYELWYLPAGASVMEPGGTFVPEDGVVVASVEVGASFEVLAVSLEPEGGSAHPTTKPLYVTSA